VSNTVRILRSTTSGNVPASLASGQIAINEADGKLFYRASNGTVTQFASGGGSALVSAATAAAFPSTGTSNVLYLASDESRLYRWESTAYVEIASDAVVVDGGTFGA
jgi:hypothetical protein